MLAKHAGKDPIDLLPEATPPDDDDARSPLG
jgi:hypothetical protein